MNEPTIDLRSDTITRPTAEMLKAMYDAQTMFSLKIQPQLSYRSDALQCSAMKLPCTVPREP